MLVYAVEGSGLISLYELENGDLAVSYTGSGLIDEVVASICTPEHAYWQGKYRHWVIRAHSRRAALQELDRKAVWLANDNVLLMRPRQELNAVSNSAA